MPSQLVKDKLKKFFVKTGSINRRDAFFYTIIYLPILCIFYQLFFPSSGFFPGISGSRYFNSDTLGLFEFSDSLFRDFSPVENWYWGTHWFVFPDLMVLNIFQNLGIGTYKVLVIYGVISYFTIQLTFYFIFKSLVFCCWFSTLGIIGLTGVPPFQDIWYPGFHFQVIAFSALMYFLVNSGSSGKIQYVLILIFAGLLSFSNEMFGIVYILTLCCATILMNFFVEFSRVTSFIRINFYPALICLIFSLTGMQTVYNKYSLNWGFTEIDLKSIAVWNFFFKSNVNLILGGLITLSLLGILINLNFNVRKSVDFNDSIMRHSLFLACLILGFVSLLAAGVDWAPRYISGLLMFSILPLVRIKSDLKSLRGLE
jgi:hypothetical protein